MVGGLKMTIKVKRAYDKPGAADGFRILVDRLWPRGLTKTEVDLWLKEIAPSAELRKWFAYEPKKWPEFRKRYRAEMNDRKALVDRIRAHMKKGVVTLLFGAKEERYNNAIVLKEYLAKPRRIKTAEWKAKQRFAQAEPYMGPIHPL
jgi:uncharacterized protein YeaO (DUF488 family)